MSGVKITYSWGDEEDIVQCGDDGAWETMLAIATEEIRVVTTENTESIDAYFDYENRSITLRYKSDDEYCYYKYMR